MPAVPVKTFVPKSVKQTKPKPTPKPKGTKK